MKQKIQPTMLGYIPIFIPLLSVLVPLAGGIPFMLFLTKVKKFGMVLIMSVLIAPVVALMGMGVWVIVTGPVAGILADLILKSGVDNYYSMLVSGYGQEYADTVICGMVRFRLF